MWPPGSPSSKREQKNGWVFFFFFFVCIRLGWLPNSSYYPCLKKEIKSTLDCERFNGHQVFFFFFFSLGNWVVVMSPLFFFPLETWWPSSCFETT
jgi:hypothetical protein